ncbi:MAG: DNA mismatch repair endonuclease MutL [Oscillospiraceae bacterium]|nr:DNA mismatch repair endonuclease MutL [Oscillospiraceae bacterium]
MSAINVLSKEISELIAAGEVIERPSSVIKELVENSIDSGARHITVEIKNGGSTYMRVTDDGCGISYEDVPKAFLRHATSKIVSKDDLDNIYTLGFRGEALASICAVSRVDVMTKQKDETYGTVYSIEGSEEKSHEKSGCPDGTTIIIRDIFYNVPARAKFMKKDVTEANAVSNIVQKIALSHPDIAVKMIRDNRMEFNSAGDGELYSAVYAVFGKDFARDLLPVEYEADGIRVSGYTVKPLYSKFNRSFQNFFINGRYVKSRLCSVAIENAYENMIMTGRFPACVLMIEMHPSTLDVNIHPSKAEVRFTDEKSVTNAVYFAVKNAFISGGLVYEFETKEQRDWMKHEEPEAPVQQEIMFTPVSEIAKKEAELQKAERMISEPAKAMPKSSETVSEWCKFDEKSEEQSEYVVIRSEPKEERPQRDLDKLDLKAVHAAAEAADEGFKYLNVSSFEKKAEPKVIEQTKEIQPELTEIKVIGEAFGLYVLVESEGKLVIIDKHAAHERIIFERLKSRNCRQYSQQLLVGIKLLMTSEETDVLENNTELLADLGFAFDFSEKPCVTVTALPTFIMDSDAEGIICEVAENLLMHKQNPQSGYLDDVLHTMACKAAVKAHDKSTHEEMKALAEQIFSDDKIRHCPHGRPVMFTMTKANIDHQFRRT